MLFVRRFLYYLLSLLLLLLLVITAWSTDLSLTFSHPAKLESWLSKSGFYDHAIDYELRQAQQNQAGQSSGNADISLTSPSVQQAIHASFTPQVAQYVISQFINANYAWLEGKIAQPTFTADLSQAKDSMASQLGQSASSQAGSLPKCSPMQLLQMENQGITFNALNAKCLPPGVTPAVVGQTIQQDAANSQSFLSNPVITAKNFNKAIGLSNTSSQPYYVTYSRLPLAYHWATRLPLILGGMTILAVIALVLMASKIRKGIRQLAIVSLLAGIVVLLAIPLSAAAVHKLDQQIYRQNSLDLLKSSFANTLHLAQAAFAKTDTILAAILVLFALVLAFILVFTRRSPGKKLTPTAPAFDSATSPAIPSSQRAGNMPLEQIPYKDDTPSKPRPPKPPTLIQL